jgi:hypothetical protein
MERVEAWAYRKRRRAGGAFSMRLDLRLECLLKLRDVLLVSKSSLCVPRHNQQGKALPSDFRGRLPVTAERRGVGASF